MIRPIFAAALAALATAHGANATVITMDINTTATLDYAGETVKLDTRVSAAPDTFNSNWGVQDCTNVNLARCQIGSSNTTRKLSDIGFDANGYFYLGFDAQEVGNDHSISIFGARLDISEPDWVGKADADIVWNTVWELNAGQDVNTGLSGTALTDALAEPNNVIHLTADTFGNDLDLVVRVPVELLIALSSDALGESLARITWLQYDYSNGGDEWTLSTKGSTSLSFLTPTQSLNDVPNPVPLPAGGLLLVSALGALGLARRRKA